MWRLKVSEGDDPWLTSFNNHTGRQFWEFDPTPGRDEEEALVEKACSDFQKSRYEIKHSSDLLMRIQVAANSLTSYLVFMWNSRLFGDLFYYFSVCEGESWWGGFAACEGWRWRRNNWGNSGDDIEKGPEILLNSSGWGWTLAWWLWWPFVSPAGLGEINSLISYESLNMVNVSPTKTFIVVSNSVGSKNSVLIVELYAL